MTTPPENLPEDVPPVVLLSALPFELAGLRGLTKFGQTTSGNGFRSWSTQLSGIPLVVVETGIGQMRAARAAHSMIDAFSPTWIFSVGFCGGLDPHLSTGQVVLGKSVKRTAGRAIPMTKTLLSPEILSRLSIPQVSVVTVEEAVCTVQGKAELRASTHAQVVEMESFAIADICQQRQTKFGILRVVSDDAQTALPKSVLNLTSESGALKLGTLVGMIWHRPQSVVDLWQLRRSSMGASTALANSIEQLCGWLKTTKPYAVKSF